jgi:hypothetical protein
MVLGKLAASPLNKTPVPFTLGRDAKFLFPLIV